MTELFTQLTSWENLRLAYENASHGKRGRGPVAAFELYLADNLLSIQKELSERSYQPGEYHSFYIL